ncbi:hypothetical protein NPIL_670961, partial [Nephila pilipes]
MCLFSIVKSDLNISYPPTSSGNTSTLHVTRSSEELLLRSYIIDEEPSDRRPTHTSTEMADEQP